MSPPTRLRYSPQEMSAQMRGLEQCLVVDMRTLYDEVAPHRVAPAGIPSYMRAYLNARLITMKIMLDGILADEFNAEYAAAQVTGALAYLDAEREADGNAFAYMSPISGKEIHITKEEAMFGRATYRGILDAVNDWWVAETSEGPAPSTRNTVA